MDSTENGWRKSSRSNGQGQCVEVGRMPAGIAVRDTAQHESGPVLGFSEAAWARFLSSLKTES